MDVMMLDLLTTYKYGWKTSYYQNTYDAKKDLEDPIIPQGVGMSSPALDDLLNSLELEEDCDSCKV